MIGLIEIAQIMIGLEILVITICIAQANCSDATRAYYAGNKELQQIAGNAQHIAESYVGKETLSLFGTIVGVAMVKNGSVPIARNLTLQIGDVNSLTFTLETK